VFEGIADISIRSRHGGLPGIAFAAVREVVGYRRL
jgi:hypothetical protein